MTGCKRYIIVILAALFLPMGCVKDSRYIRVGEYRNVALNPNDVRGPAVSYPHAESNSECRNEACFAARNVIDGKTANTGHGPEWPSWGPDQRNDLWLKIDFGGPVETDKVVIYIRADFPHDNYWRSGIIEFSDGTSQKIAFQKTASAQVFQFAPRQTQWIHIANLIGDVPPGWCGFTEVEVWGWRVRQN